MWYLYIAAIVIILLWIILCIAFITEKPVLYTFMYINDPFIFVLTLILAILFGIVWPVYAISEIAKFVKKAFWVFPPKPPQE